MPERSEQGISYAGAFGVGSVVATLCLVPGFCFVPSCCCFGAGAWPGVVVAVVVYLRSAVPPRPRDGLTLGGAVGLCASALRGLLASLAALDGYRSMQVDQLMADFLETPSIRERLAQQSAEQREEFVALCRGGFELMRDYGDLITVAVCGLGGAFVGLAVGSIIVARRRRELPPAPPPLP